MNRLNTLTAAVLTATTLACTTNALAGDATEWQRQMLLEPSGAQLAMEQRGRVMIYDGLTEHDVDLAMNSQFDRIDRMMFVRTKVEQEDGGWGVEEDGCD